MDIIALRQIRHALDHVWFRQHSWIFHCNLRFQMSQIGSAVALHDLQLRRVGMRALIEPDALVERDAIDNQSIAVPLRAAAI